jgi:hypothetical protein
MNQEELDKQWQESFLRILAAIQSISEEEACELFMRSLDDTEESFLEEVAHRAPRKYRRW